jgi:hypothetical protein
MPKEFEDIEQLQSFRDDCAGALASSGNAVNILYQLQDAERDPDKSEGLTEAILEIKWMAEVTRRNMRFTERLLSRAQDLKEAGKAVA